MADNRNSTAGGEAEDKLRLEEGEWKGDIETHLTAETGELVGILEGFQLQRSMV